MHGRGGTLLAQWPYDALETLSAPDDVLRLGRAGNPVLARLEVTRRAIGRRHRRALAARRPQRHRVERRLRTKVILWSVAATVSLLLVAIFGVPLHRDRARAAGALLRSSAGSAPRSSTGAHDARHRQRRHRRSNAAAAEREAAGRAAFDKLMGELETAAGLPIAAQA